MAPQELPKSHENRWLQNEVIRTVIVILDKVTQRKKFLKTKGH